MRYYCHFCHKSVTNQVPDATVIRAILICPECLEAGKLRFPADDGEPSAPLASPLTRAEEKLAAVEKDNQELRSLLATAMAAVSRQPDNDSSARDEKIVRSAVGIAVHVRQLGLSIDDRRIALMFAGELLRADDRV
jgi:hypothetical protein